LRPSEQGEGAQVTKLIPRITAGDDECLSVFEDKQDQSGRRSCNMKPTQNGNIGSPRSAPLMPNLWDEDSDIVKFTNCRVLLHHKLVREDLWIHKGKIINAQECFWRAVHSNGKQKFEANVVIDCQDHIIIPGYIDLQLNGAFGIDFSSPELTDNDVKYVSQRLLEHGVTSYCPTMITSTKEMYHRNLPLIQPKRGNRTRAHVLGAHLEGPFMSESKYGAHPKELLQIPRDTNHVLDVYGKNFAHMTRLVTIAPELPGALHCIKELYDMYPHLCFSAGHSMANLEDAQLSVEAGVRMITHLFNAMVPFHHRNPGLIGLLGISHAGLLPRHVFYGLISDGGIHTHAASIRMAWGSHPRGAVIVTDAMAAMGLDEGVYKLGQMTVNVTSEKVPHSIDRSQEGVVTRWRAVLEGTDTLAGSVARMDESVRNFWRDAGCSFADAVDAATLHPARAIHMDHIKGSLEVGKDADFLIVDESLFVKACIVQGELAWNQILTRFKITQFF
jgi:N-acetylglucosamine-6-phosphate deacetylase